MDVNRGLGLSGSFSDIPLLEQQQPGELRAQSAQNSSEQLQTLGAGEGMAQRPAGVVRSSRSSSFSSISSLGSMPRPSVGSRRTLLRQENDAGSRSPLLGQNGPLRYSDRSKSVESLSSGTQLNHSEPQEQRRSPSLSSDQAPLLGKSNIYKRRSKKNSGANEREPKPDEDERPRKHKTKSKDGSSKLRQQLEEQIPKYCCIAMGESSDSDSSDEEEESNVNKKVVGLFCLGMLAGIGSTLAFFRYGGAAATAVSGFASISHSVNTDSTVKGSDNKVLGSGGSGLINVNLAKGGANIGLEATDSLGYPGMSEALKAECLKKGMTYIDPATGEWIGYSSTAGTGKCLLDIPRALIKGRCLSEKYESDIKALKEKLGAEYEVQRINNIHKLMMAEDRRAFELASVESRAKDANLKRYISEFERNSLGWSDRSRGNRNRARRDAENDEQIPSTSSAPQATDAETRELLDAMRGTTANQEDRNQGLNWLKKANKRR